MIVAQEPSQYKLVKEKNTTTIMSNQNHIGLECRRHLDKASPSANTYDSCLGLSLHLWISFFSSSSAKAFLVDNGQILFNANGQQRDPCPFLTWTKLNIKSIEGEFAPMLQCSAQDRQQIQQQLFDTSSLLLLLTKSLSLYFPRWAGRQSTRGRIEERWQSWTSPTLRLFEN